MGSAVSTIASPITGGQTSVLSPVTNALRSVPVVGQPVANIAQQGPGFAQALTGGAIPGISQTLAGQSRITGRERPIDESAFAIQGADAAARQAAATRLTAQSRVEEARRARGVAASGQRALAQQLSATGAQASQQQQAARAGQTALAERLEAQARGDAPSLAQAQLQAASDRSLRQQLAVAASQRGGSQAALQRALVRSQGAQAAELSQQSAQLRLQEQQIAQQQLGQLLASQRQADIAQAQFGLSGATSAQQALAQQAISTEQFQDRLVNERLAQGFTIQQAQQQAAADLEKLRTQQFLAAQGITAQGVAGAQQAQSQLLGAGIGAAGAALASDEKLKKNIKSGKGKTSDFLNALSAREFEFRDTSVPGTAPGKRVGILAQDLEKSEMGKALVKEVNGNKTVDTVQGFAAVLAAQSVLNERLNELEKQKKES